MIKSLMTRFWVPWVLATTVAFIASCFHGDKAPSVTPANTLAPGARDAGRHAGFGGPFAVVFGSPRGETYDASEVTLVFNRPMRALDLAGDEAKAPAQLSPEVPGSWRWIGTNALLFAPEESLPNATRFVVTVPANTRALDGSTLKEPYTLEFSTPRPKLVSTRPHSGEDHLLPSSTFALRFNQPVALDEIKRAVKLTAGQARNPVPFEVRRPDPANPKLVELHPSRPLPLNSPIALVADKSLKGTEGPLDAGEEARHDYKTYGPLEVASLRCSRDTPHGKCAPRGSLSIQLSNPVKYSELRKAITVTPPIKVSWWESAGDDHETRWLHLDAPFAPARTYTIRVAGGLRDIYGQRLGTDQVQTAAFDDLWPEAEIGVTGAYFEPKTVRDIAVASVNVKSLDLATIALDDESIGLFEWNRHDVSFERVAQIPKASVSRLHPGAAPNVSTKNIVRPAQILGGAQKRGPMAIAVRYDWRPGRPENRPITHTRVVQVTDLAISAKVSKFGSLVWVTRLSDGKPVADAEVRIRAAGGSSPGDAIAKTDANGFATFEGNKLQPSHDARRGALIIVRHGEDWAYRNSSDLLWGWRYGVPTDLFAGLEPFGMIFSERGLYRPGDTVRLKGILRKQEERGTSTPGGAKANLRIGTPTGGKLLEKAVTLSAYGTFSVDVVIPRTAELGSYDVSAVIGEATRGSHADAYFEVAEYRPSEFKVGVELDKRSYIRGDRGSCTGRGDYLFGAPMTKAKVRTTVTRGASWFSPPGSEEFSTSDSTYQYDRADSSPGGGVLHSGESQLDESGTAKVDVNFEMPGQQGPEAVSCEAEVMDLSRQTVASTSSAIVHPASFYLGIQRADDGFVKAGDEIEPRVMAVNPEGKRQPGTAARIELIRRSWVTAREASRTGGYSSVSRMVDEPAGQCDVTTTQTTVSCKLKVPRGGYFILRATSKDKRGNPVAASMSLYALGAEDIGWSDSDDMALELVPDKKSYEVGETARVLIKSPFTQADALVTVERSGIYHKQQVRLSGSMPTISIPITDEYRPNAYLSVVLLRGRTKAPPAQWNAADVGAPAFRVGYTNLVINPEARRLKVALTTNKKDYRPGERASVDMRVVDRAGKPAKAEVTLYAVDEGVLMLTGYKTPDPIPVFTQPRVLQVGYTEARTELAKLTLSPLGGTVGADKGLEGGGGGDGARKDFRQSAYFNPSIITDDEGRASVSFDLPESLTTYRVMAVVTAQDDRFGFADAQVTTSLPLMARPAFPRLLRTGDAIEAGVIVTAKGIAKSNIDVRVTTVGLSLVGDAHQAIELDKGQSREVRFTFQAKEVGDAKLRFNVQGGGEADAVEFGKRVVAPTVMEAVALYGQTTDATGERLGDFGAMRTDVGGLEVSVASTALVGLNGSVEYLTDYPYECSEQLTSRLVPLLPLRDLARTFDLPLPKNTDVFVANTVGKLVRRQRHDGGFGMWEDSPSSNAWVTAYVLWGLGHAQRYGVAVPARTIDDANNFVRRYLESWSAYPLGLVTAAFMLDVLAENGSPDHGYMSKVYEQRDKLPLFGKAYLAHAFAVSKGDEEALAQLETDLEAHVRVQGNKAVVAENVGNEYAQLMDSSTRTTALVLRSLLAAQPKHTMAAHLARGLLGARDGGRWNNTQESAYALLALDDYRKAQEKQEPDFIASAWLGDAQLFQQSMTGRNTQAFHHAVSASRVHKGSGQTLAFQMGGDKQGTLFYEARLKYARKEMPSAPLDRGFYVQKSMRVVSPQGLQEAIRSVPPQSLSWPQPRGGELVLVDLLIVSPQPQDFVVVDDPLPAGLEAVDTRLSTTAGSISVDGSGGEDDSVFDRDYDDYDEVDDSIARGDALLPSWFRQEIRDDRVVYFVDHMAAGMYHYRYLARATTIGTFMMPATKAEAMYQPEIFGRTAGSTFKVTP